MNFEDFSGTYMGSRTDAPQTTDHALYVQTKASLGESLEGKIRYQFLTRSSDFRGDLYADATDSSIIKTVWRPADTADKKQHSVKAGVEYEMGHNLVIGAEYGIKYNDYTKTIYGTLNDIRHEFYLDADYKIGSLNISPFVDIEYASNESRHRRYTTATNYASDIGVDSYTWTSARKDISYALGANAKYEVVKGKAQLVASYRYENANGSEDFAYTSVSALATPLTNNNYVDTYRKHSVNTKVNYALTKNTDIGLGYKFENLRYTDDHYTDYAYMIAKTAGVMFTGAYANPNYDAHLVYVTATYKF